MNHALIVEMMGRLVAWLLAYAVLLIAQCGFESWLIGRIQQRRGSIHWIPSLHGVSTGSGLAALGVGLAGGALLPLAPDMAVLRFGDSATGLLASVALLWVGIGLLALSQDRRPTYGQGNRYLARVALLGAFPTALILASVLVTIVALPAASSTQSGLSALIAAQGAWNGMQWIGLFQPLAGILWLACILPPAPAARDKRSLSWQVLRLNRALLTSALLFGGWQGLLVARANWLGLVYSTLKVTALCALEVWVASRSARVSVTRYAGRIWALYVPLAALNLCLTVGITAMR